MNEKIISPIEADEMLINNKAIILDVRDTVEYKAENIEGAINHPLANLNPDEVKNLSSDKVCIIQCLSGVRAGQAYEQLSAANIDCCILEGGIKNWKSSNLPTNKTGVAISLMRQVQIVVGGSVLLGSILTMINSSFIWIPFFFGAGLLFAGISGFCGMLKVLERMPWNK